MSLNKSISYPSVGKQIVGRRARFLLGSRNITSFSAFGRKRIFNPFHANDNSVYRPEVWAAESVNILNEEMVYGGIVHRDFENKVARQGEIVHTRKPNALEGKRKQNDRDTLDLQDVSSVGIDVELNQRVYVSFVLGDEDRSKSFKDLVEIYLREAITGQTRVIDRAVGAQAYQFLDRTSGTLSGLTKDTGSDYMVDMRKEFNDAKVPADNRWLGLASRSESELQKTDLFKSAERVGDGGRALQEASLGRKHGWNTFLELNTPSVTNATTSTTTTMSAATSAGSTSFDVASGAALTKGGYITIAGDMTPLRVTDISTNTITVNRGLKRSVASGAVVTPVTTALVNQSSAIAAGDRTAAVTEGYPAKWAKEIVYDGTGVPQDGQLVSFTKSDGTVLSAEYGIIGFDGTAKTILLDRPLEDTVDDDAVIGLGPSGDYNFALQRSAVALVNRPLAAIPTLAGAISARGFANNVSLRITIGYTVGNQVLQVTVDGLFGVAVLDDQRGGVLLG